MTFLLPCDVLSEKAYICYKNCLRVSQRPKKAKIVKVPLFWALPSPFRRNESIVIQIYGKSIPIQPFPLWESLKMIIDRFFFFPYFIKNMSKWLCPNKRPKTVKTFASNDPLKGFCDAWRLLEYEKAHFTRTIMLRR